MLTLQIKELFELSKYTDIVDSDIKVMTPNGLKKIYGVDITSYDSNVLILKTNKHELMCSPDHLIKSNNKWVKAKDFKINDIVDTKYGKFNIKEILLTNKKEDLLDLHVDGSEYYTNDIVSHNSSFQETIDFSLFGIVRGKERKRIPLKEIPNRTNKSLLTSIKYINDDNDTIGIERGLEPTRMKIEVNENDITNRFKKMSVDDRENFIGINYDIYKSFVSMSLNDFANFINLDPETKRKLLNRLFNLEEIDEYYDITKNIIKNNQKIIDNIIINISNNNLSIDKYKKNVENIKEKKSDFIEKEEIKEKLLSNKSLFTEQRENIKDLSEIYNTLSESIKSNSILMESKKDRYRELSLEIKNLNEKIEIFDTGVCPLCKTELKSDKHDHNKKTILEKKEILLKDISDEKESILNLKKRKEDEWKERYNIKSEVMKLKKYHTELKFELKELKSKYENFDIDNKAIIEISKNIEELNTNNEELSIKKIELDDKNDRYKKLLEIFSNEGIRKNIISNIVKPINISISKYLNELESQYRVELNDNFDADIYERYVDILHPESLSTGESRKVNIAIALSYLEVIRKIKKINILFLDEVFANIDMENIDIVLRTLKKFSKDNNINIVIVNHSPVDIGLFDRIIKIEKDMFSNIKEEPINI